MKESLNARKLLSWLRRVLMTIVAGTVGDLRKHLATMDDSDVIAYCIWEVDDVLLAAVEIGVKCNKSMAKDILTQIHRKHDASIGINWDVVKAHIKEYKK
jgi:hypothetical protein